MPRLLPGLPVGLHVFLEHGGPSEVVRRAARPDGDAVALHAHGYETLLAIHGQQHGRIGLLVGLRDGEVRFVEGRVVIILPLEAGEVLLRPELLQDLQELKELLPPWVRATRAPTRPVNEPAFAELVDDGDLFRDLEGVLQHEMLKGVAFMGQGACGDGLPGLPQHRAVDGRPDLDPAGAAGEGGGEQERLRVHARLLGKVPAPEPDVVPAHRLHRLHFFPVLGVRVLLEQLPATIFGVPGHCATVVQDIPGMEQSKVHHRPSCVAERYDPKG